MAKAHRTFSRPLTGAEAHLLGQELNNTETRNRFLLSFVIVSFGAFPHRVRTFRKLTYCQIPPPPQNRIPPQQHDASLYNLPSPSLSQQPRVPCLLVGEGSALSDNFNQHTVEVAELSLWGEKHSALRPDSLFRRGGMRNAAKGKGSASVVWGLGSGEEIQFPFVFKWTE